MSLNDLKNIFY